MSEGSSRCRACRAVVAGLVAVSFCAGGSSRCLGAGFLIFEQGTKPMGMTSTFAAQANDPSTLFFNPGSLSFFSEKELLIGITGIWGDGRFVAAEDPDGQGPSERQAIAELPPHLFWLMPLSDRWSLGLAEYTPFGLVSEWKDPDGFAGRFVSTEFLLKTLDLSANVGYRLRPDLGLSAGVVLRLSTFEHHRRLPAEQGAVRMAAQADDEIGLGWNAGIYFRPRAKLSFGLSYRSAIAIDHGGEVTVTAPTGDDPINEQTLSLESRIRYPGLAIFGVAFRPRPRLVLEVDVAWTGWSTFYGMTISVPQAPELSMRVMDGFADSVGWRIGFQYTTLSGFQYRGGVLVDESPQPSRDLSPVLADADRIGFAFGVGYRLVDLSLMYIMFDDRKTVDNRFGLDGAYTYDAWLFGATLGY